MSEQKLPIKASILYAAGLVSSPLVKVEDIVSVRVNRGMFMPSVRAVTVMAEGEEAEKQKEMEVYFPVFVIDATSQEDIEYVRELLHKKIDASFDSFLGIATDDTKPAGEIGDASKED